MDTAAFRALPGRPAIRCLRATRSSAATPPGTAPRVQRRPRRERLPSASSGVPFRQRKAPRASHECGLTTLSITFHPSVLRQIKPPISSSPTPSRLPSHRCRRCSPGGLVDPRAKAGWAELERHQPGLQATAGHPTILEVFHLYGAVRVLTFQKRCCLNRKIPPIVVAPRRAVYSDFELRACHCG